MGLENLSILDGLEISWIRWFFTILLVFAIYWVVRLVNNALLKTSLLGGWNDKIYRIFNKVYILVEPVGVLIIIASFILINPFVHGIMSLIVLSLGYNIIKSYFSGKVIQLSNEFFIGQKVKVKDNEGFIQSLGRTSLTLQTKQGAEYISYGQLFESGYTQLQGKRIGGLEALYIDAGDTDKVPIQTIKDKLWESPYLDWSFDPEIAITNQHNKFEVKVLLKERDHLEDFKDLINEWGYTCTLKK